MEAAVSRLINPHLGPRPLTSLRASTSKALRWLWRAWAASSGSWLRSARAPSFSLEDAEAVGRPRPAPGRAGAVPGGVGRHGEEPGPGALGSAGPGFCERRRPALLVAGEPLPAGGAHQEAPQEDGRAPDRPAQSGRAPRPNWASISSKGSPVRATRSLQSPAASARPPCLPPPRDLCPSPFLQPGGNFLTTLKPSPKPWPHMETKKGSFCRGKIS